MLLVSIVGTSTVTAMLSGPPASKEASLIILIVKIVVLCLILCVTLLCAYQLCFASILNEAPAKTDYIKEAIVEEQEVSFEDSNSTDIDNTNNQEDNTKK